MYFLSSALLWAFSAILNILAIHSASALDAPNAIKMEALVSLHYGDGPVTEMLFYRYDHSFLLFNSSATQAEANRNPAMPPATNDARQASVANAPKIT